MSHIKAGARHNAKDMQLITDSRTKLREIDSNLTTLGAEDAAEPVDTTIPADNAPAANMPMKVINTLKAISKTDDELRVGNHIVLFGGRDLTAFRYIGNTKPIYRNADGSAGEFFGKAVDLESGYTELGRLAVDWEHGQEPDTDKDAKSPGRHDVLGYVDWKTAKRNEQGVFVERVLNRRKKYVRWLEPLIEAGLVGTSSEAVPNETEVKATGEIVRWPLHRDTLTVTPLEPRMATENVIAAMKALGIISGSPTGQLAVSSAPDGAKVNVPAKSETPVSTAPSKQADSTGESNMDEINELKAELGGLKAAVEALTKSMMAKPADDGPTLPPSKHGAHEPAQLREDDSKPFKNLGEQTKAYIKSKLAPNDADPRVEKYQIKRIAELKAASGMTEGAFADGGTFVQTEFSNDLIERTYNTGQVLSRIPNQPIGANFNSYSALLIDESSRANGSRFGGLQVYRVGEGGSMTQTRPKFRRKEIKPGKIVGLTYLTDELIQDAVQLEGHINRFVPMEFAFKMEDELFNGSGVGESMGVLNAAATVSVSKNTGQTAATIEFLNLTKMWERLWPGSEANAMWCANKSIFPQLMQMSIPAGTGALSPLGVVFANGQFTIFGRPVMFLEYCAALGTVGDLCLVDFSQYIGVSKGGIKSDSSMHVLFTTDEMSLRWIIRYQAEPTWNVALTPKAGSTFSPYVTLATRA